MEDNYSKAYRELIEVLKYVPKKDVEKIPKDFIESVKKEMDKEYDYKIEEGKPFNEQILLIETKKILAYIYINYWATEERRKKIMDIYREVNKKADEEKIKKYGNNVFDKQEGHTKEKKEITIYKEIKWYKKFLDYMKKIFNIRK